MDQSNEIPTSEASFKPKLIIWDLDDTLWQGTLAEGDHLVLDERRASFVRTLNQRGIVSAICSKNDPVTAKAALEGFGLWDAFVFPRIAFVPKGPAVQQLIADMQLRPVNVLFIDDNPHNLHEVAHAVPGIRVMDATSDACDALLQKLADDHAHISKSRLDDYRMLEVRLGERAQQSELSDEAFLMQSGIQATFTLRGDNVQFADRIEELINRSNQLNYTASRTTREAVIQQTSQVMQYDTMSVFVWDKYGYYGLVGVAIYDRFAQKLLHLAFSCRIMHMGVEHYLASVLLMRFPDADLSRLSKPLPQQSSRAITHVFFGDPAVRAYVLEREALRDPATVEIRIMADCQSGVIHHYSGLRDIMEFDNAPRLFNLPMMMTGEYRQHHLPRYLVYTAALDYVEFRWLKAKLSLDYTTYFHCVDAFCHLIVNGNHKALIILPPLDAPPDMYRDQVNDRKDAFAWEFGEYGNDLWFSMAARYPDHICCIDLTGQLAPDEVMDSNHYRPSVFKRVAGMVDEWYAWQTGTVVIPASESDAISLQPDVGGIAETGSATIAFAAA